MSAGDGLERISRKDLFARLAGGHAARCTVVTPNRRLAAALNRDFDARQTAQGLPRWDAPDILPLAALTERLYADALYSDLATGLPLLLEEAQEQALWEEAIEAGESGRALLSAPGAAALAREAWQVAHAWRLAPRLRDYPSNDDAKAFAEWAWRFEGLARRDRHTDRARLPDVLAPHLAHAALRRPAVLVAYGFDILTPQQREFFDAVRSAGTLLYACAGDERASAACRVAFASAADELGAAARWARARLEANPAARIGVVVPDLAQSRTLVRRVFLRALEPAHLLPGGAAHTLPFNISLGEPLGSQPLVAAVLLVLDIAQGEVGFAAASRLIRSPFIAGAEAECVARARLDAELRAIAAPRLDLGRLRRAVARATEPGGRAPACPLLSRRLANVSAFGAEKLAGAKRPAEWGKAILALLDAIGFPGERGLDSSEYQALKKFHELVAGFAALERVAGRMRFAQARARLARSAADTPFQPETPPVPIQILGVLESAGIEFDHLWVSGLSEEAWPMPARPNPFIPVALQRAAGVPEASAAASLELDRRITRGWLAAAGEVVLSHPLREDDRELVASPLIREVPPARPEDLHLPRFESLRDAIRRARREQRIEDSRAPPLAENAVSAGGTGVFRDQAACPFRAFAAHRLGAQALETPPEGLDAAGRGELLHALLAAVWSELESKARLEAMPERELEVLLATAAERALDRLRGRRPDALTEKFAALEKARIVKLGRAWLDLERKRSGFEVIAVERKSAASFGRVGVNAKLDRLDRLDDGAHAVIDYKTGAASTGGWWGARPDEPQLPLYALGAPGEVAAVAFACVKAGEPAFKGVAREAGLLPGVKTLAEQRAQGAKRYGTWPALLAGWKQELESLGREFAAGEARVAPKRGEQTCSMCELQPLCRINERMPFASADEAGASAEDE